MSRIEEDHEQKENQSASVLFGTTSTTINSNMASSSNHSAINHFRNNNDTTGNERIVTRSAIAGGSITQHSNTVTSHSDGYIPNAPNQVQQNQTPSDIEGNGNECLTLNFYFSL